VRTEDTRRRLPLPGNPRGADGHPIGSRCEPGCHRPTTSQAHCTVCHGTFSGVHTFDRHRVNGECLDPTELGLTQVGGFWSTPEGHAKRAADGERLRQVRAARPSGGVPEAPNEAPARNGPDGGLW
jgi:hypothetical protein